MKFNSKAEFNAWASKQVTKTTIAQQAMVKASKAVAAMPDPKPYQKGSPCPDCGTTRYWNAKQFGTSYWACPQCHHCPRCGMEYCECSEYEY